MSIVIILGIILLGGAVCSFGRFKQAGDLFFQDVCVFFGVMGFALAISTLMQIISAKERKRKYPDEPEGEDIFSIENIKTFFLRIREFISPFGRFF